MLKIDAITCLRADCLAGAQANDLIRSFVFCKYCTLASRVHNDITANAIGGTIKSDFYYPTTATININNAGTCGTEIQQTTGDCRSTVFAFDVRKYPTQI